MANFAFQAKSMQGKVVNGEVEASSESEAKIKLKANRLIPLKVVPKQGAARKPQQQAATPQQRLAASESILAKLLASDKVRSKELQIFTRQFSVLISSGVPIVQALEAMAQGAKTPALLKVLTQVLDDVSRGRRLAEAMERHPNCFDRMYVNLVHAGEEGGVLDTVLKRLADYIEKSEKIKGKIKGALWYPAAIIVVAILVISGIMIFVIPSFVDMFKSSGTQLPALTRFVMDLSHNFVKYWYVVAMTLVAVPVGLIQFYKTDEGRKTLDSFLINTPLLGMLVQKGAIARFARTLATLLSAGVRIVDCLDIAASTSGNWVIERAVLKSRESIQKGRTIVEPLAQEPHIPHMVTQMIGIGEQTGNLDTMLNKIADFFEDEVETAATALTSMIEPILMVVLGGIIAVLVLAMYLPIFNLANTVGA